MSMRIPKCLYNYLTAPINRVGIYTRRNCVDKATQIGKDLVDISKSALLTRADIDGVIKKHAKGIKMPNLVSSREEAIELAVKYGTPQPIAEARIDSMPKGYYALQSQLFRGIYISPKAYAEPRADILPHELEHYFFENCTFSKLWARFKYKTLGIGKRRITIDEGLELVKMKSNMLPKIIQPKLIEHFGTCPGQLEDFLASYSPNAKGFVELLSSDKFIGLKNKKRIDAQIRAFLRSFCNPKNGEVEALKNLKFVLKEETNAYTVSDRVLRYDAGKECLTRIGVRKEIYKRAVKILDKEIKIAKHYQKLAKKTNKPLKEIKTGEPSACFRKNN